MMFITNLHHPHCWYTCNSFVVHIDLIEYQLIIPKAYIIVNSKNNCWLGFNGNIDQGRMEGGFLGFQETPLTAKQFLK